MKKFLSVCTVLCALFLSSPAPAQVPDVLNYQGRVVVNGMNFNGSGQFKFALVNNDGSTTHWSNDGSSSGGSQPAVAVNLTVYKGLYSVLLGDTTLANMTAIAPSTFTNSDVRLRVWFSSGSGFQLISPDQRIGSAGYAIIAGTVPDGSITAEKLASGAVSASAITNGTLGDARLSTNVALLNGMNSFSGSNNFNGPVRFTGTNIFTSSNFFSGTNIFTNSGNAFVGSFRGNGTAVTNLNATNLAGVLFDSQLSTNVVLLNGTNIFRGTNQWNGVTIATNGNNQFVGRFSGDGAALTGLNLNVTNFTNVAFSGTVTAGGFIGNADALTNLSATNLTGTIADARLSTNVAVLNWTNSTAQLFHGITSFTNTGNTFAGSFIGNGAGLTNIPLSSLPTVPITNNQAAVTLSGTFNGNGGGLTNLNATNLTGTLPDARLSSQVPLLDANSNFRLSEKKLFLRGGTDENHGLQFGGTGFAGQIVDGPVLYGFSGGALGSTSNENAIALRWDANGNIYVRGSLIGNGSGLTNLNLSQSQGTFSGNGAGLTNIPLSNLQVSPLTNQQTGVTLSGTFAGDGGGLTNLNAANLTNTIPDARLSANVALLSGGKLSDSVLSANIGLLNGNQTITGIKTFSPATGAPFAVTSTTKVANLNADSLDGLNSTDFLRANVSGTFSGSTLSFSDGSQILADAGTEDAPGYSFNGDSNTGIYNSAANTMSFSTGGTGRMTIDGGSVGIGTNSPGKTLDVVGTARISGATTIGGTLTASGNATVENNLTIGGFPIMTATTNSPTAGGTLSPTTSYVKLAPTSAVTLNATTAIANGSATGTMLMLQGTSDSNTVTIGANANTKLGAARVLGANDILTMIWSGSSWVELSFANF